MVSHITLLCAGEDRRSALSPIKRTWRTLCGCDQFPCLDRCVGNLRQLLKTIRNRCRSWDARSRGINTKMGVLIESRQLAGLLKESVSTALPGNAWINGLDAIEGQL